MIRRIGGGVCAATGFSAGATFCAVKASASPDKEDLMILASDRPCNVGGVFTLNTVKAAPVRLTKERVALGKARAIIANSGNANCCAPRDMANAKAMSKAAAEALSLPEEEVLVCSTGVIGEELRIKQILQGVPRAVNNMGDDESNNDAAVRAIRTTDTVSKICAAENELDGITFHIGGIAKGSGMIHPNMGTMLCFVTTDAAISSEMLQKAIVSVNKRTFSRITVDGDTSTNDSFIVLANGAAGNPEITFDDGPGSPFDKFQNALYFVCSELSRMIAADGEGATKLIKCNVAGLENEVVASKMARVIVGSSLVKAAMFGCDANWGRVICAMGYSGIPFEQEQTSIRFHSVGGSFFAMKTGVPQKFEEDLARKVLDQKEVTIDVTIGDNFFAHAGFAYGCDLTYDYVKINGDYRT